MADKTISRDKRAACVIGTWCVAFFIVGCFPDKGVSYTTSLLLSALCIVVFIGGFIYGAAVYERK